VKRTSGKGLEVKQCVKQSMKYVKKMKRPFIHSSVYPWVNRNNNDLARHEGQIQEGQKVLADRQRCSQMKTMRADHQTSQ
jgi:hypothetical protein